MSDTLCLIGLGVLFVLDVGAFAVFLLLVTRPPRTAEEVARELIAGLEDGSITLGEGEAMTDDADGWTFEELAEAAISIVQCEPAQPSGLGMRRLIASLFEQVAQKATAAERERCSRIAETWADPEFASIFPDATGCAASFNEGLACSATTGIAAAIRENER